MKEELAKTTHLGPNLALLEVSHEKSLVFIYNSMADLPKSSL